MSHDDDSTLPGPATLGSLAPGLAPVTAPGLPPSDPGIPATPGGSAASSGALEVPRYALTSRLGRGGMGEVHAAHDAHVDREVAVKLLRGTRDADAVARFLREARIQGRLEHPSIVPVHDLGQDSAGRPYFAMKRLAGITLADILTAHAAADAAALARWPRRALLGRLVDVCNALELAHRRGVVHRDVKPQNIMLGDLGEAYILDWGIARVAAAPAAADGPAIRSTDLRPAAAEEAGATKEGALLGTPGYMAPEQITAPAAADARADVYALGCVLFEVLTLRPALPRGMPAVAAALDAPAHRPAERCPEAEVPPELDAACAAATALDPAERLASAGELGERIQAYLDGDRDLARRRALAAEHAAAARTALSRGDASRPDALRDAGRALALDPANTDAQQLLAHLLLERPAVTPPAVRARLAAEKLRSERGQLRAAALIYLGFLAVTPLLFAAGMRAAWPVAAAIALTFGSAVGLWWQVRRAAPVGRMFYAGILGHCTLLGLVGAIFSPVLLVPLLAMGSTAAFSLTPTVRSPAAVVIGHALSFAVPLALELAGAVPRTFTIEAAGLRVHPWAISADGGTLLAIVGVALLGQAIATVVLVGRNTRAHEEAQEDVHLQSWHLQQLLG